MQIFWSNSQIYSIVRCIDNSKFRVNEGELRCEELSVYLEHLKTVKTVWLAEDATAIVPKLNYDPKTNQIVGLLLPLNKNGCPTTFRFANLIVFNGF